LIRQREEQLKDDVRRCTELLSSRVEQREELEGKIRGLKVDVGECSRTVEMFRQNAEIVQCAKSLWKTREREHQEQVAACKDLEEKVSRLEVEVGETERMKAEKE
jgi:hypothetical protein